MAWSGGWTGSSTSSGGRPTRPRLRVRDAPTRHRGTDDTGPRGSRARAATEGRSPTIPAREEDPGVDAEVARQRVDGLPPHPTPPLEDPREHRLGDPRLPRDVGPRDVSEVDQLPESRQRVNLGLGETPGL